MAILTGKLRCGSNKKMSVVTTSNTVKTAPQDWRGTVHVEQHRAQETPVQGSCATRNSGDTGIVTRHEATS
jgi:hypothetical protein